MLRSPRSLSLVLAAASLLAPAAAHATPQRAHSAAAKKKAAKKKATKKKVSYPTVSRVAPMKAGVGDKLVIKGASFRSGKGRNYVVFKREGGRALFVKADKATTKQISITVPAKILGFLEQKGGVPQPTRFRLRVLATRLGKAYTKTGASPLIGPSAVGSGGAGDCDADGTPNAQDNDDDNDLLSDAEEAAAGTDPCKRDTDGDGMSDGWEVQSAKDRNGGVYPKAKPNPNPKDEKDAAIDSDGDGLSNLEEYVAWATYGGNAIPLNYSGGNATSGGRNPVPAELAFADRDHNGYLSDLERDADGDGIPNMDEERSDLQGGGTQVARLTTKQPDDDPVFYDYGIFSHAYLTLAEQATKQDLPKCAGINQVPFYCVDQWIKPEKVDTLDWMTPDTDGDGVRDDNDDVDHDGVPNITEYQGLVASTFKTRKYGPLDACYPSVDNPMCLLGTVDVDKDGLDNAHDTDDDGDGLSDTDEIAIGTNSLIADTDGDGVSDAFEYYSAKDLNSTNLPYPGKRPYPNPLDGTDAGKDFDSDSLTLAEEYKAWRYSGSPVPLSYSDGTQWSAPASGLRDDQRDVDSDGLDNWTEAHGPLSDPKWWDQWIAEESNKCFPQYIESPYPTVTYLGTSFVDPDSDGDGLNDGADDIDHDGYTNQFEAVRPANWCSVYTSSNMKARVQPFNPCKPTYSSYCHAHPPFGYYGKDEDWASPLHVDGP